MAQAARLCYGTGVIKRQIQLAFTQVEHIYGSLAIFFLLVFSATAYGADVTTPEGPRAATPADAAQKSPQVLVNRIGFTPRAAKYCLVAGGSPVAFEIIDAATGQAIFTGHTAVGHRGLSVGVGP